MLKSTKNLEEVFAAVDEETMAHIMVEYEDGGVVYMRLVKFSYEDDEYDASATPPKRFFSVFSLIDFFDYDDLEESEGDDIETIMTGGQLEQKLCEADNWLATIQGE